MDLHASRTAERAVHAVLAGASIEAVSARLHSSPERLAEAVKLYCAAGRTALDARSSASEWQQVNIEFTDYPTAQRAFLAYLLPSLREACDVGAIGAWWFVRKFPCWRLRVVPGPQPMGECAPEPVHAALDSAVSWGVVKRWWPSPYEAETVAFGGTDGMRIAHALFHADSAGVLDYLRGPAAEASVPLDAKATSLIITSLLLRAAGQEWSEQGDVWARVEAKRPLPDDVPPERVTAMTGRVRKLLTADTASALTGSNPLAPLGEWADAIERSGQALGNAGREGRLGLGTRGILARHILFHWNRMGFTTRQQAIWSRAARETILGS
ncbi:thiopeptide-type bacteriocin biosynthesis protein [Streptomyces sp. NBC_01622]|uniref:thiopeptide-type bacteriocin biosynthesis protein n=1 Tax=unclassified Streptomyces TaxID=2593676 RepID=UPI0022503B51|nr:thiopeptide-type bacteriocin biosynthesis protein [Streptomyces sp. NBC_00183]MCX5286506.1 thiopeptide-type bacteriocin biosynthesis protein [Streptomyces sp. NBC_00183]WTE43909.1 thiopeptide-type bacteriocin biosynthesis protein [Streptomyces sp. NBC_01622]